MADPANAPRLIDFTLEGIVKVVIDVPAKAFSPMAVTDGGREYSPVLPHGNQSISDASLFKSTPSVDEKWSFAFDTSMAFREGHSVDGRSVSTRAGMVMTSSSGQRATASRSITVAYPGRRALRRLEQSANNPVDKRSASVKRCPS